MSREFLFSSESVSEGHPDKVADQISDSVLDAILAVDKHSRVACETLVSTGLVVISGEITTTAHINYREIAQETIKFTRNQILVSAGTSVLAQANIVPQSALTLLGR